MAENDRPEEFRPIAGWPGYQVSNNGRVQSRHHSRRPGKDGGLNETWHDLVSWLVNGYPTISMFGGLKARVNVYIHTLVLQAFVGPKPPGMEACHNNGIRHNNRVENLRWDTRKGNFADKLTHGTDNRGEKHYATKLTAADVLEIRAMRARKVTQREVAVKFGISRNQVSTIDCRRSWSHLEAPTARSETE